MGPPIIELEFEKAILDLHNNWKRKHPTKNEKKIKQLYVKGTSSLGIPKSFVEATRISAETAQSFYKKKEHTIVKRFFTSTAKNPQSRIK